MGKKPESDAVSKVPKPSSEFPKQPFMKTQTQALEDEDPTDTDNAGKEAPKTPEEMADEENKKVSGWSAEKARYLSGRKSFVGSKAESVGSAYLSTNARSNKSIKEYLKAAGIRGFG